MKVWYLFFAMVFFAPLHMMAQGVEDKAVIPVSVTLNSIMRLNIVSGGNIEFVFNTLQDYQNGLGSGNEAQYATKFTVASSVDFKVQMIGEDADLINTDQTTSASTMPLDNVGFLVEETSGAGVNTVVPDIGGSTPEPILNGIRNIVLPNGGNAGGVSDNDFTIYWRCGTTEGNMRATPILDQSIPAGRYSTTVFLNLLPN